MNNKLIVAVQYFYKFIVVGFYFWLYLIKGFVVYSLYPSFSSLLVTLRAIVKGKDGDENVKTLFKRHYEKHSMKKLPSFIFSLLFIALYTLLYFVNKQESALALLFSIVLLYLLGLSFLMFIYSTVFISFRGMEMKDANLNAFVSIIKNLIGSIAAIAVVVIVYIIGTYNFAIFIVIGPFLVGMGIILALDKYIREV